MRPVIVIKPAPQGRSLAGVLEREVPAGSVHFWPPFDFEDALKEPEKEALKARFADFISESALFIVVSPTAANFFHAVLPCAVPRFATVGKATAERLRDFYGLGAEILTPDGAVSEGGAEKLLEKLKASGLPRKAVIIRGDHGREFLADELEKLGVQVEKIALYRRIASFISADEITSVMKAGVPPVIYITSSEAVEILAQSLLKIPSAMEFFQNSLFLTIHPRIESALHKNGFKQVRVADEDQFQTSKKLAEMASAFSGG